MSHTGTVAETGTKRPRGGYVVAILGTEVLVAVLGILNLPGSPGGNMLQLLAYPLGLLLGIVLWLRTPSVGPAVGLLRVFLVMALTLCVLESGRVVIAGKPLSPVVVTVVALVLLIWMKPPDRATGQRIVDAMAVILIAAVGVTLILESAGVALSWYRLYPMFDGIIEGDNATYWLPLASMLGLDGRWAGPFPHPNMAGPVGGFLIVVGLCRRGSLQWWAIGAGVLVLLLTGSRTSTIAALAGALVVLIARASHGWPSAWVPRVALLGTPASSSGCSLPRRSTRHRTVWHRRRERPWSSSARCPGARRSGRSTSGSGWSLRGSACRTCGSTRRSSRVSSPGWAITAHNMGLDALVRFGVAGAMLLAVAIGVAALMAGRAARSGQAVGLGTRGDLSRRVDGDPGSSRILAISTIRCSSP